MAAVDLIDGRTLSLTLVGVALGLASAVGLARWTSVPVVRRQPVGMATKGRERG